MGFVRFGPQGSGDVPRSRRHRRVLVADGDPWVRAGLEPFLSRRGFHVFFASDGKAALRCLALSTEVRRELGRIDVVIADVDLPHRSGIDILMAARGNRWDVPVVLTGADVSPVLCDELIRLGAAAVLKKPLSLTRLEQALSLVVEDHAPLRNVPCFGKDPQGGGA